MKELLSQEELNLKRLAKSPILMNFVKKMRDAGIMQNGWHFWNI